MAFSAWKPNHSIFPQLHFNSFPPPPVKGPTTFLPVKALWTSIYFSWDFSNSCHRVSFPFFSSKKREWEVKVSWSAALQPATESYYSRLNLCSANVTLQRFNFNREARPEDQIAAPKTRQPKDVSYLFYPHSTAPSPHTDKTSIKSAINSPIWHKTIQVLCSGSFLLV